MAAFAAALVAASPAIAQSDWSDFRDIGGFFPNTAPVTAVVRSPVQIDLFITGNTGHVYTSWWTAGSDWTGIGHNWRNIGGIFPVGAPVTAISRNPNQLDVFITGTDGRVYTSWWTAGSDWSGLGDEWTSLGGFFPPGAPVTAIARNPNTIDLFVTGNTGVVYTSSWSTTTPWSGVNDDWKNIGGSFPPGAPITAISRNPNQIDLFITGNQGIVYTSYWTEGGEWTGIGDNWRDIGGSFPPGAPITAISRNPNQIDLFITGSQGNVYTSWWAAGISDWTGIGNNWRDIGGVFPAGARVSALSRNPNRIDLFTTGNQGNVYTSWWASGSTDWTGIGNNWREIGGTFPPGAPLSAISRNPDLIDLFVTGHNGIVYTSWSIVGSGGPNVDPPPPNPTTPVRVIRSVDFYQAPGGQGRPTGVLEAGTAGVTLVEPCANYWCHVAWPGGRGWVYDGPGYYTLER